jgi:hypothetical protein
VSTRSAAICARRLLPTIRPREQDDDFLADVAATRGDPDGFRLWWLGKCGFLVQWRDRHLLLEANRAFVAERLGIDPAGPVGLDDAAEVEAAGFRITACPRPTSRSSATSAGAAAISGTWRATASPDAFVAEASRIGQPFRVLRCGEGLAIAEAPPGP